MKKFLFVFHTLDAAKQKFHETVELYSVKHTATRVSYSDLFVEFETFRYEFISASNGGISERLYGKTFNDIIVDEMVTLTEEQEAILKSRLRGTHD